MRPTGSEITTSPRAAPSSAGTPRGELGSATPASSGIAAWLSGKRPQDVDSLLVSRASQRGVGLRLHAEHRFPRDANGNSLPTVTVYRGCQVTGPADDAKAVGADMARLMTPAPPGAIEGWLAELSVITARRQDDAFTEELRLTAYATRLARYPADVARAALLDHPWKFWPTWVEVEEVCEKLTAPRRMMLNALSCAFDLVSPPASPDEERERVTAEAAAKILAEFGFAFPGGDE